MFPLGYVYGNLMVNVHLKNEKLSQRGVAILERAAGISRQRARQMLAAAQNRVPVALVMAKSGASAARAEAALKDSLGHVRNAIALATKEKGRPFERP